MKFTESDYLIEKLAGRIVPTVTYVNMHAIGHPNPILAPVHTIPAETCAQWLRRMNRDFNYWSYDANNTRY